MSRKFANDNLKKTGTDLPSVISKHATHPEPDYPAELALEYVLLISMALMLFELYEIIFEYRYHYRYGDYPDYPGPAGPAYCGHICRPPLVCVDWVDSLG